MDGGLQSNRDSLSYPFEPKDKPNNWGGLIEPFWIGQNQHGAQSISLNNSINLPFSVEGKSCLFLISTFSVFWNFFHI